MINAIKAFFKIIQTKWLKKQEENRHSREKAQRKESDSRIKEYIADGLWRSAMAEAALHRCSGALDDYEIYFLIKACIKKGDISATAQIAKFAISEDTITQLIRWYIEINQVEHALEVVQLNPSKVAIDSLIKYYIQLYKIKDAKEVAKLRSSGILTVDEVDGLVMSHLRQDRIGEALALARNLGASKQTVNVLIDECIEHGEWYTALEALKLEPSRALTLKEIDIMVEINARKEELQVATAAAKLGASSETIELLCERLTQAGEFESVKELREYVRTRELHYVL